MHLIKNSKYKKLNFYKKKPFLIVSVLIFMIILCIFIKSKNKEKNPYKNEYEEVVKEINAKRKLNFTKIEKFITDNENIYGTLASLLLAKKYISMDNLEKAFIQLKTSLKYTKEENLKNILRLRMSQIKIQQNHHKDAMEIIQEIKDNSWQNIVENIKGDIFAKNKKNRKLAIKAWEKSKYFEDSKTFKEIINMKINEIK